MHVLIQEFPNQNENEFVEGMIMENGILSTEEFVPEGVRVMLTDGSIGNVKDLVGSENSIQMIKKRISDRENHFVEKKSSLSYDVNFCKENKYLETVASIAVQSFLNSEGGFVYLGVSDDGLPLGLNSDYSLIHKRPNDDGFEDKLWTVLTKFLGFKIKSDRLLSISFPVIDNVEICEIYVRPSKVPIFLKEKTCTVIVDNEHKPQRKIEDFYIRNGNSHYLISKNSELIEYVTDHFTSI